MKLSKFNISIPFKGKFVYSNTFTQKFLLLDPFLMDLVHAVTTEEELSELQGIHPDLYNSMVTNGFIIDSNIDEIDRVRQVIHAVDNKRRLLPPYDQSNHELQFQMLRTVMKVTSRVLKSTQKPW